MDRVDFPKLVDYIEQLRINRGMSKTELSTAMGKNVGYWSDMVQMGPHGRGWRANRSGKHHLDVYAAALAALDYGFYVGPVPKEEQQ